MSIANRKPAPPWDMETAATRLQAEEDAWNTRDPEIVVQGYAVDAEGRDRLSFLNGRDEIKQFLGHQWAQQLDYRVKLELWGAAKSRMAVRFTHEYRHAQGQWYRGYGVQVLQFDDAGDVLKRFASVNVSPINASDRCL